MQFFSSVSSARLSIVSGNIFMTELKDNRKLLSAAAYISCLFSWAIVSIGVPIAILALADDPIIQANAKESLNFQINMVLYAIIFGLLCFVLIGIPLLIGLGLLSLILPIIATVKVLSNPDFPFKYPLIWHIL
jgi:uncharacterized protein